MNGSTAIVHFDQVRKERPVGLTARRTVLHDLSFTVVPGEIVGLLGHNGAGKSTAMRILLGLVRPDGGTATAFGAPLAGRPDLRRRVAYVPENARFPEHLTPREQIELCAALEGRPLAPGDVEALLARVALPPGVADRRFGALSKGMMQRVALALMELSADAELLVLDEPATGLDPEGRRLLRDLVRARARRGAAALLSSHDLAELGTLCDRVVVIREGRLLADTPVRTALFRGDAAQAPSPFTLEDYYLELMGATATAAVPDGPSAPAQPLSGTPPPESDPGLPPPKNAPLLPLVVDAWRALARDRIGLALVVVALLLVALAKATGGMTLEFQSRVLKDLSLACVSLVALTLFPLAAAHGIRAEFERGTLGPLFARPVGRGRFLAARFLATAFAALLFVALLSAELFLLLPGGAGSGVAPLAGAGFLIWLKTLPGIALACALAPHAGRAVTTASAAGVALVGHMADGLSRAAAEGSPLIGHLFAIVFGCLLPDYAPFAVDFTLPGRTGLFLHLALLSLYAAALAAVYLALGRIAFARKDL